MFTNKPPVKLPADQGPGDGPPPREPLLRTGTVGSGVSLVLTLLVVFGVPLTMEQQVAILGVAVFLAPCIVAAVGRRGVYSPASVQRLVEWAKEEGRRQR